MTDMTKGNPFYLITMFSIPMLFGNILNQLYNVVDSFVVGRFVGDSALAAVGAGFPIIFMIISIFLGFSTGATILIAQFYGSGDIEKVSKISDTIYGITMIGVIPLTVLGVIFCGDFLKIINVPADILMESQQYISIILLGMFFSLGQTINTGILQALGDSKTPLLFLLISCVINIALDLILVVVFDKGIMGAAVATIIAQLCSWLVGYIYIRRKHNFLRLNPFKIDKSLARRVLKLGIPFGVQQSIFSIGMISIQSLANTFGSSFVAGFNVAGKLDSFAYMPIRSFDQAIVTYTAQNIGAKKIERIKAGMHSGLILSIGVSVVIGGLVMGFAENLMQIFSTNPEVVKAGVAYLYRILPFYFMVSIFDIWNAVMRGAGEMLIPMFSTIISLWIARVPAAYILTNFYGKESMFFCYAIGWIIGLMISGYFYFKGKWRNAVKTSVVEV